MFFPTFSLRSISKLNHLFHSFGQKLEKVYFPIFRFHNFIKSKLRCNPYVSAILLPMTKPKGMFETTMFW